MWQRADCHSNSNLVHPFRTIMICIQCCRCCSFASFSHGGFFPPYCCGRTNVYPCYQQSASSRGMRCKCVYLGCRPQETNSQIPTNSITDWWLRDAWVLEKKKMGHLGRDGYLNNSSPSCKTNIDRPPSSTAADCATIDWVQFSCSLYNHPKNGPARWIRLSRSQESKPIIFSSVVRTNLFKIRAEVWFGINSTIIS